ncbi:uncharacterized protein LOC134482089 isoform X3 [Rattus norvegicus]|uniref:uncharacterized protein LOC134482089 isoform X3 n=1 Tax=Rattus norvegicus TaxID=10116 RepID=UPI002FD84D63
MPGRVGCGPCLDPSPSGCSMPSGGSSIKCLSALDKEFAQKASCQPSSTPEEEERMNSLEKLRIALHKMQKERDELQRILSSYPRNDLNYSLRSCLLLRESLQLKLKAKRARNENRALLLEQIALEESIKETTRFCAEACLQFSIRSLNSAQTRTTSLCDRTVHQEH